LSLSPLAVPGLAAISANQELHCAAQTIEHYTTTETDSEGRCRQVQKTRETRHNTWSAAGSCAFELAAPFPPSPLSAPLCGASNISALAPDVPHYWEDISSPFPDLGDNALTRLTFSKKMVFADQASENHFKEANVHFINTSRDQHMDFSESFNVTGFTC
jgi:hypothetical protein